MSLRNWTPCDEPDLEGRHHCPYAKDGDYVNCEWYCDAEEPQDDPYIWGDAEEDEEEEPTYEEEMAEEDGWDKWECEPSCDDWDDC